MATSVDPSALAELSRPHLMQVRPVLSAGSPLGNAGGSILAHLLRKHLSVHKPLTHTLEHC